MGKPAFYIGENKGADQLRGNREADQRLCFRYMDSTIPLFSKFKIFSLQPSPFLIQLDLRQICSETTLMAFSWLICYFLLFSTLVLELGSIITKSSSLLT